MTDVELSEAYQEYFERIAKIRSEMDANGESSVRHKDIHAGQVLLFSMAADAKEEALKAKKKAKKNARIVRNLIYVVIGLVLINIERIPDLIEFILGMIT